MGVMGAIVVLLLIWGLPIFVSHKIGAPKRRAGWAYGLLLGWLGVVVIACLGPKRGSARLTSATQSWSVERERPQRSPLPKSELKRAFAIFAGVVVVGLIVIAVGLRLTSNPASATPPMPPRLTHAQLVRTANSNCLQARRQFDKQGFKASGRPTLRKLRRFLRAAIPRLKSVAETLARLEPPLTDQVSYRRLLYALAAESRAGRSMLHDVETGQIRRGLFAGRHVDAIEKRARRLERKLGLTACMKLQ